MLDGRLRPLVDPVATRLALTLVRRGISADQVTLTAFAIGLAAAIAIIKGAFLPALVLILVSRLADAVDGAVARAGRPTDYGGYLDIVLDFAFYGLVPLAFVLHDPAANGLAGAALLFSFYVNGASFLAFAALAAKRGLASEARGKKSIVFTTGLAEASETLAVFVLSCLVPGWFAPVAFVFAAICLYTALARILEARAVFSDDQA